MGVLVRVGRGVSGADRGGLYSLYRRNCETLVLGRGVKWEDESTILEDRGQVAFSQPSDVGPALGEWGLGGGVWSVLV